jgi:hypothetical protein
MKIFSPKIFLLFLLFILFAAILHQLSNHYLFKYMDSKINNEYIYFYFIIISILFGSFVYAIRIFSIYFYGKNIYFIDVEFIYSYIVFILSFAYGHYILKLEIPYYTYIIGIFISLLFILNFILDIIYKKTIID